MNNRDSKKVLYLGGFELPDKNAAAQRVMAIGKTLRDIGCHVSFLGLTRASNGYCDVYDGFVCESLPYPSNTKDWLYHITEFVNTDKIDSYHPDYVILYNFPAIASMKILRHCHKHGINVLHDTTEWEQAESFSFKDCIKRLDIFLRMRYCLTKMDGVIVISRFLYDYYSPKVNTVLIPPTVDLEDAKWCRKRELGADDTVRLVYAGNAGSKIKDRLDYVVEAISKFNNFLLTVVGLTKEQYEDDFGKLPSNCNNICFFGRIPHKEAVKAVCDADFQVLIRENTLKNRAGFPTKFVESITCCTPLIATLSSNIADYLVDEKNGFIVEGHNSLDKVLERISLLSKEDRIEMKSYCRDNNPFDYRNYTSEINKLLTC